MYSKSDACILIVDDETGIRKSFESFFSDYGYTVYSAETAEKAMEYMGKYKLDVAIVDLKLPGIGGEELILKMYNSYPELKFIIHTGSVDYKLSKQLIEIGLVDSNIVHKPQIDMNYFIQVVEDLIK